MTIYDRREEFAERVPSEDVAAVMRPRGKPVHLCFEPAGPEDSQHKPSGVGNFPATHHPVAQCQQEVLSEGANSIWMAEVGASHNHWTN